VKTGYKGEAKRGFSRQFSGIYFLHPTDSFETSTLKEKSNCSIRPQVSLSFFVLDERCSIFLLRMSTVSEGRESSKPMETPPTLQKPGGANTTAHGISGQPKQSTRPPDPTAEAPPSGPLLPTTVKATGPREKAHAAWAFLPSRRLPYPPVSLFPHSRFYNHSFCRARHIHSSPLANHTIEKPRNTCRKWRCHPG
jgi:hypothetical protein